MHVQTFPVTVTTDASGDATAYSDPVNGLLSQARYVKTDFANGVDFTITSESTGETLWTESDVNSTATRAPRQATHSTAGVAAVYAAGGGATAVNDLIAVSGRIKIVVGSGGDTKTGTFYFVTF
jgi:hypothetical protein